MSTFTKWNKLPSELREHSLSYCKTRELGQYAQLTHLCNDEIQHLNTIAPKNLTITELKNSTNGIVISVQYPSANYYLYLHFMATSENTHKLFRSSFTYYPVLSNELLKNEPIFEGNARQTAFTYLEKLLRYTAQTKIEKLFINCEEWPYELKGIPKIFKTSEWFVHMYPSMYDTFMSFMNETINVKDMYLHTKSMEQNIMTLPAHFFKSTFFKQLECAEFAMKAMISDEDFLSSEAKLLKLKCDTISENAINRKIQKWCATETALQLKIELEHNRRFDIDVIRQNMPFEDNRFEKCLEIRRQDGKVGYLRIDKNVLMFGVD